MAHRILGVDLGAWSVKVAELEAGFRQSRLVGLYERPLLPPEEGEAPLARAARTVRALMDELGLEAEMCATTMGGEALIRLLSFPFGDRKKIEQVLAFELESQILGEVEALVTDFVISNASPEGTQVIAVAAPKEEVRARIAALAAVGAEPRVVGAAALGYAALQGRAFGSPGAAPPGPLAVLDLGHRHTHLCVVDGEVVRFARSIPRGGEEITVALAEGFQMTPADAERAKHAQAFVLLPGAAAAAGPAERRIDGVVRDALRPLVRELRQTMAAYRAGGGPPVQALLVTGGGARLRGLLAHLEHELGLPSSCLTLPAEEPFVDHRLRVSCQRQGAEGGGGGELTEPRAEALTVGLPAQAVGLALAAAAPVAQVNLRRGELAYRTDYSFLRGKARALGVSALAVLLFGGLNAWASLRALRGENEALAKQLKQITAELFGEARTDGKAVSEELRAGPKGGAPPVPALTAYDVLDEISRHVPPGDKARLDVLELDIKPKKTYLKATAASVQQIDDLVTALEEIECFKQVEKGKISSVSGPAGASGDKGDGKPAELKQFTLTITTTCP